jgi:hypothetical protein
MLLTVDEAVTSFGVASVTPAHRMALAADGVHDGFFGFGLSGPTPLIRGQA